MTQLNVISILLTVALFQVNCVKFPILKCQFTQVPKDINCVNTTFQELKDFIKFSGFELDTKTKITFIDSIFNEINDEDFPDVRTHDSTYNFRHNYIKKLHIDAFKHIDKFELNIVDLLTTEKSGYSSFTPYRKYLSDITITKNHIKSIDTNVFTNITIGKIDLSSNQLTEIKSRSFSNLESILIINLSHNNLTRLQEYTFVNVKPKKLREFYGSSKLDLSHNQISVLDSNAFNNLDIDRIDLEYNRITSLNDGIFTSVNIITLLLSHNQINYVSSKFFENMDSLLVLKLADNQIKTLSSRLFLPLKGLSILSLTDNPITTIEQDAFDGLHGVNVDFMGNTALLLGKLHVSIIPTGGFNGLRSLTQLDLSNWNITRIDAKAFYEMPRLKSLNLQHNQLTEITPGAFYGLEKIDVINLSYNRLRKLTKDMFEGLNGTKFLPELESESKGKVLTLRDLFVAPEDIEKFGLVLNLKHNEISAIDSDAFTYLANLIILDVSENYIKSISIGTFKGLRFVSKLDIHQNNLTVLEKEVLYPMVRLAELNLAENHLETLDVRAIVEHSMADALKTINLNHNQWKCEDLRLMILLLTENKIDFISSSPEYFDSHNVHGIRCVPSKDDDIEERLSNGFARQSSSDVSPELLFINYQKQLVQNSKSQITVLIFLCFFYLLTSILLIALYILRNKSYFNSLRYPSSRNPELNQSIVELLNVPQ